ncbi:CHAP domain-containing protein [bacterium]|nr:CHAP domain-containing protein [bacterium]
MFWGLNTVYTNNYVNRMVVNMYSQFARNNFQHVPLFQYTGAFNTALPTPASFINPFSSPLPVVKAAETPFYKVAMDYISSVGRKVKNTAVKVYSSISNFGSSMVSKAKSYLGYNEANGSYKLFTNGRVEAWCADFVSYCARQCGVKDFNFRSVQQILDWGRKNNRFSKTPKVGDAIIFKGWDAKRGRYASHTGIVSRVEGGKVYTVEGNTSDKVAERYYSLNDSTITGYVTIA